MAYVPNSGSVVAFQSDPAQLQASVTGTVSLRNLPSVSGTVGASILAVAIGSQNDDKSNSQNGLIATGFNYVYNGTNWDRLRGNSSIGALVSTGASSIITTQGTSPWVTSQSGSIATVIIGGSIAASFTPPANQSVSGTVNVGNFPASVGAVIIGGSIAASFTPPANQSVSGTVGASLIGLSPVSVSNFPVTQNVSGSVVAFAAGNQSVSGTVLVSSLLSMPAIVSTANSTTTPVTSTLAFTGTGEEWKDFGSIVVNVFTDAISGVDGLSIQQSSDNTNWDITDTYTVPSMASGQGKTFQVQPAARFGRIVYTQGVQNSGAFRLQTIYHPQMVKPTSQRAQDNYSNETDLEQNQVFPMLFNNVNWDRWRGNSSIGALVSTGASSVITRGVTSISGNVVVASASIAGQVTVVSSIAGGIFPISGSVAATVTNFPTNQNVSGSVVAFVSGTVPVNAAGSVVAFQGTSPWVVNFQNSSIIATLAAPSIVGTYGEDSAHTSADKGIFTLGVRNDTIASFVSANTEYSPIGVDSAGRTLTKPFSPEESRVEGYNSVVSASVTTLLAAAGTGLRNYVTDLWVANTGATTTLITFRSQGGASVLGYTIAPAGGGSNLIALATPIRSGVNETFDFQATTSSSILFATCKGFKAP